MESDTNVQRTLRAMVFTLAHIFVFVFVEQKLETSLIHQKTSRLQRSIVSLRDLIPLIFKCRFTGYFSQIFDVQVSINFLQIFGVHVSIHICLHKYSKMPDAGNKEQWS